MVPHLSWQHTYFREIYDDMIGRNIRRIFLFVHPEGKLISCVSREEKRQAQSTYGPGCTTAVATPQHFSKMSAEGSEERRGVESLKNFERALGHVRNR